MAKKLLPNRLSKTVPFNALMKIRQAMQLIIEVIGEDTPISEAEYKALLKIADRRKQACDDVLAIMQEHPQLVLSPLSVAETQKDKAFYEICDQIQSMFNNILIRLKREQNIAGAEYANACSIFESDVDAKAMRGDTEAQIVQNELKSVNRITPTGNVKKQNADSKTV
jgi:hypothetical protein